MGPVGPLLSHLTSTLALATITFTEYFNYLAKFIILAIFSPKTNINIQYKQFKKMLKSHTLCGGVFCLCLEEVRENFIF